ncbi:MAG: WD40/YVTN/BNR-like repeat-containing protein [Desulfococcaceae bacterium]
MTGGAPTMAAAHIGRSVPPYVNAVAFPPEDNARLWVGCDAGAFFSEKPGSTDAEIFQPRNAGLAALVVHRLAQHPGQESLLLGGTAGNGCLRYAGQPAWSTAYKADDQYAHASGVHLGDARYPAVNWADPYRILIAAAPSSSTLTGTAPPGRAKALILAATNGGAVPDPPGHQEVVLTLDAGDSVQPYSPLVANTVATPVAAEAERVAFGSRQLWISDNFGAAGSWNKIGPLLSGHIRCITFAGHARIFVGCVGGEIYRYGDGPGGWNADRLDTQPGLPTGGDRIDHPVTDIAVDPASPDRIYVTFGGAGVFDRVWHYDGAAWSSRMGPAAPSPDRLPQTRANTVAADPHSPGDVYVGTDLGVWHSADGGATWHAIHDGLPEIPVSHLLFHDQRVLRASTEGRGVFEWIPDAADTPEVRLLVRDHQLDTVLRDDHALPADDPTDDNADPGNRRQVTANTSPDIRIDAPDNSLRYLLPDDADIDFAALAGTIGDEAASVAVPGDPDLMEIVSRVYIRVQNTGTTWANGVRVTLLAARDDGGVPDLPNDFQLEVARGAVVEGDGWVTVGRHSLDDLRPGVPAVVRFDLSTRLLQSLGDIAAGANFRLLCLVHHPDDPFTGTNRNPETLALDEAKAAGKRITTATLVAGPVPVGPVRTNSWKPIGPAGMRKGQTYTRPLMSGRAPDVAIAPDGRRVYLATANAGVWRTDDRGESWVPLMRGFDLNPVGIAPGHAASDGVNTLAMGAVAIDEGNPDRVYVGTGEAFHGYMGVGPLVSDDGGNSWRQEAVIGGNLMGHGFYALAVDPGDPERVVAATTNGLYRREPVAAGASLYHWVRKTSGLGVGNRFTSVAAVRSGGQTHFFAARFGGLVFDSTDGDTWTAIPGYPTVAGVDRVLLALQPGNPNVIYGYNERGDLWRNTRANAATAWTAGGWQQLSGLPPAGGAPAGTPELPTGQLWYDMALAVSPGDANVVFIGSSTTNPNPDRVWSGAIFRLDIDDATVSNNVTNTTYIGNSIHPDIHRIRFRPGSEREMWVGCDGGIFYAADAFADGDHVFVHRNAGVQSLETQYLGVHPRSEAVLFAGTQDNGGIRYTGEPAWLHVTPGDGGYAVVDWNTPHNYRITYARRVMRGSATGGVFQTGTDPVSVVPGHPSPGDMQLFYAPLEVAPTGNSQFIVFGSRAMWWSPDFGANWNSTPLIAPLVAANVAGSIIRAVRVVSTTMVYVGTMDGQVWRYTNPGAGWGSVALHTNNVAGPPGHPQMGNPFTNVSQTFPILAIFVDPADATNNSIYVTIGGRVNGGRVWHFNGGTNNWSNRDGAGDTALPNAIPSAITVDPANNAHVYVGTDIGVWRATNGGAANPTWRPFSNRLPDTTVRDLEWHAGLGIRLLRASTYGSGVWEYLVADPGGAVTDVPAVELYLRNSQLDGGREGVTTQYGANWRDPTDPTTPNPAATTFGTSPDIKINPPDDDGEYAFDDLHTPTFVEFMDDLPDPDAASTAKVHRQPLVNRVYVMVHNRGEVPAEDAEVILLIGARTAANDPADLPADFRPLLLSGGNLDTDDWKLVGRKRISGIRAGLPRVVRFDLSSDHLPAAGDLPAEENRGLLVLVHQPRWDPFRGTEVDVPDLCNNHRQAAYRSITVRRHTGRLPRGGEALPGHMPVLLPLTVAMLAADRLRRLHDRLALKRSEAGAGATIRDTDRRVAAMAERAIEMFQGGDAVPAPESLDLAADFSKFALMGCAAWDLLDMADILEPESGWIGNLLRRGTPDPNYSQVVVGSAQFAIRAAEIALSRAADADKPKIQAFAMGMMSALATQLTCHPILRGMQATRNAIDWDHNRVGLYDYAVGLWISRELMADIPATASWNDWWPGRGEVPDALFEGLAEAFAEVFSPAEALGKTFADWRSDDMSLETPTGDEIADGYRLYRNSLGQGEGIWFLLLLPLLIMPGLALLIARFMPNARHLLGETESEPDERSWYEVLTTGMALGSLTPFVYNFVLWGFLPRNLAYSIQSLLFGLTRIGFGTAALATTDAEPEVRWGALFAIPASTDLYAIVRAIAGGAQGRPGDARLWLLQAFPLFTGLANLVFTAITFKAYRAKDWVFWILWPVYLLALVLGAGIPAAIVIARKGGLLHLFRNRIDPDRPDLVGVDPRTLYRLPEARAHLFDDGLGWTEDGADPEHSRYPAGRRALVKVWSDHDDMEIRHDRDLATFRRGGTETPVLLDGPLTAEEIAAALAAVDGVNAEVFSGEDPVYDLPAPSTLSDPGDAAGTWAEHDELSDDFVALSDDPESPYLLRHTPRSVLTTALGRTGTGGTFDAAFRLLPESGSGAFDGTGVDLAAELAAMLCMGATPSVNGADINVAGVAGDSKLGQVHQIFRQWNLDERRVSEWKTLFAGGGAADDLPTRPTPGGYAPAPDGGDVATEMGWVPAFRAWAAAAGDRHADSEGEKRHPRTPFIQGENTPPRRPKNRELTTALRFLLDLP